MLALSRRVCSFYGGLSRTSASVATMRQILDGELQSIQDAGTWKHERIITTKQAAEIQVKGSTKKILNFCANNYLGLSVRAGMNVLLNIHWFHGIQLSSAMILAFEISLRQRKQVTAIDQM